MPREMLRLKKLLFVYEFRMESFSRSNKLRKSVMLLSYYIFASKSNGVTVQRNEKRHIFIKRLENVL